MLPAELQQIFFSPLIPSLNHLARAQSKRERTSLKGRVEHLSVFSRSGRLVNIARIVDSNGVPYGGGYAIDTSAIFLCKYSTQQSKNESNEWDLHLGKTGKDLWNT